MVFQPVFASNISPYLLSLGGSYYENREGWKYLNKMFRSQDESQLKREKEIILWDFPTDIWSVQCLVILFNGQTKVASTFYRLIIFCQRAISFIVADKYIKLFSRTRRGSISLSSSDNCSDSDSLWWRAFYSDICQFPDGNLNIYVDDGIVSKRHIRAMLSTN